MKPWIAFSAQRLFGLFGLQVRRLNKGVEIDDALEEQLRLAGDSVSCIFEVGAANGRDTLVYAKRCVKATIYAYEPLPKNFSQLVDSARQEPRIIPVAAAMSGKSGSASFHVTALGDASSLFKPRKTGSTFDKYTEEITVICVPVVTLQAECARLQIDRIDLLKMDAQGAELDILRGAEALLDRQAIRVIYTEINFLRIYHGGCVYHELASYLEEKGYLLHSFYDIRHDQRGRAVWGDAIFIPQLSG